MGNSIRHQKFAILSGFIFGVSKLENFMLESRVHTLTWKWIPNKDIVAFANEKRQLWRECRGAPDINQEQDSQSQVDLEFNSGTTHKYIIDMDLYEHKFIPEAICH